MKTVKLNSLTTFNVAEKNFNCRNMTNLVLKYQVFCLSKLEKIYDGFLNIIYCSYLLVFHTLFVKVIFHW